MKKLVGAARQAYAEELRYTAHLHSLALIKAFATVPRERFVGPGPWWIRSPLDTTTEYWSTDTDDPRAIYHDVLVALDRSRGINNGQPQLWAFLLDRLPIGIGENVLHLGCGTGYYTAIMAELVGSTGTVTALELDAVLAQRATKALRPWRNVSVRNADGATAKPDPVDVIIASAGVTNLLPSWLDALRAGGRLLCPLTPQKGFGEMLLITHDAPEGYSARFLTSVGFIEFKGARSSNVANKLAKAFERDRGRTVKSLRRDQHRQVGSCWLHADGWCLSCLPAS
jgi:protein-L-isoaspartate(D-aspartate) O-methyltransferase